jgi:type IV pilus assembly protein PilM
MFEFFKTKKNRFIGIDFGTSSVKVVELSYKDQKAFLENYGLINLEQTGLEKPNPEQKKSTFDQKMNDAIKKLIVKMNPKSKAAYISIPGFSGLITIIELPEMQKDELAKAIQFEAHKYIPSSLDEITMSWEIIEHIDNSNAPLSETLGKDSVGKKIKVLLVAAPK